MDAEEGKEHRGNPASNIDEGPDPEPFDVLSHEIRLEVIEVLAERRRHAWLPHGLSFAELFDRVDVADSGKFNYHLGKLRGTYVHTFDGEYVLSNAGFEIAGAIRAGTLGADALERRGDLERSCPRCTAPLKAVYEYGYFRVVCEEHGDLLASTLPPTAVRDRDLDTVYDLATARARDTVNRVQAGGCPHCWGHATLTAPATPSDAYLDAHEYTESDDDSTDQVLAAANCADCGMEFWLPVSVLVAEHPAVQAYYHEKDVAVDGDYLELAHITGSNGTVVTDDPLRIEVDVDATPAVPAGETAEDVLVLTLDEQTTVLEHRRDPRSRADRHD